MQTTSQFKKVRVRKYLPLDFKVGTWDDLKSFYNELSQRSINSKNELQQWIYDLSELEAIVSEDMAWRYIKMTCNTADEKLVSDYTYFVSEIEPNIAPYSNELNKKLIASEFCNDLDKEQYFIFLRSVKKSLELFREENIPLFTEISNESQKYGAISGAQTIEFEGKHITMQMAAVHLKSQDRDLREKIYHALNARRAQDETTLNNLFNKLIELRNKVASNAGFGNFRDYMFQSLGRFDYVKEDCFSFHDSIQQFIVPLYKAKEEERKNKLNYPSYRPWDRDVDIEGKQPLKPFANGAELTEKTIECFNTINPFFGECIGIMRDLKHLDLESRVGKAPGGYNYPLYETGVPFIFMNSVGTHRDLVTMVHEGGHAIHSFLTNHYPVVEFQSTPSEVAELASMSMELISMEHWDVFFKNEDDFKRAKREQLEKIISSLPWIASIDKFQHWIYENPTHTVEERYSKWLEISKAFGPGVVDYSGLEDNVKRSWQVQLHLFEVPFYYIEYGFAQLGAIAMWRNYKKNPDQALQNYIAALKLGYTKSIPEIYKTAGIKFDFSSNYIAELANFLKEELAVLG